MSVETIKSLSLAEMVRGSGALILPVRSGIRWYKLDPTGVAVDKDGNIYVTDVESHRLSKFITLMDN